MTPDRMTPEKKRRVATAVGFLSGVLASRDALPVSKILWPPDTVWEGCEAQNAENWAEA